MQFWHVMLYALLDYAYAFDCQTVAELWLSFGKSDFTGQNSSKIILDWTNTSSCCDIVGVSCNMSTVIGMYV
jgi:hypothetical protein